MSKTPTIDDLRSDDGGIDARALASGSQHPHTRITERRCARLRRALLNGASLESHATATDYGKSAAHTHATGACHHDIDIPPLRHVREGETAGTGRWVVR